MRALLALMLFVPMAAHAGPLGWQMLRLPADAMHQRHPGERKLTLAPVQTPAAASQPVTMNIGPFEAEIGGQDGEGRHKGFAHYHLEGTRILGGSLGGSFSSHSAKLELTWKNE